MTLPKPELDDRTFNDLVQEAQTLIPRYAPQWTDHNRSDPGITFIELFAWLTEMSLYRVNQITDRHRLKYLRLLGTSLDPAVPAQVEITLNPETNPPPPTSLPKGFVVYAKTGEKNIPFELDDDATIAPLILKKVIVDESSAGVFDRTLANMNGDQFFTPFGMSGQPDCALYLGFESGAGNGSMTTEPITVASLSIFINLYEQDLIPVGKHGDETAYEFRNAKLVWEYLYNDEHWREIPDGSDVPEYSDATQNFQKSGRIIFQGLTDWKRSQIPLCSANEGELFWLRCRVRESHFEYPPRIQTIRPNTVTATQGRVINFDNETRNGNGLPDQLFPMNYQPILHQSLLVAVFDELDAQFSWGNLSSQILPFNDDQKGLLRFLSRKFSIDWIMSDTVTIESTSDNEIKIAYASSFALLRKNENENCVTCSLDDGRSMTFFWQNNGDISDSFWTETDDFNGSGPDDRHFVVDYENGEVLFGDGRFGKVPEPGSDICIIKYRTGGGESGNVSAGQKWGTVDSDSSPVPWISNIHTAKGGSDRETIDEAFSKVRRDLKIPYTTVTSDDFEKIACCTPGLRVAKASAFTTSCTDPGKLKAIVKVVVVPFTPLQTFTDPPVPSEGFLDAVCRHIDRHRLLGTTVRVTAPEYVRVAVDVTIVPDEGYLDETIKRAVTGRLTRYLHPISGGPDQDGWPIGRMVARSELYDLLDETTGVNCVIQLGISGDGSSSSDNGNLKIPETATVYPGTMAVNVTRKALQCRKSRRTYE